MIEDLHLLSLPNFDLSIFEEVLDELLLAFKRLYNILDLDVFKLESILDPLAIKDEIKIRFKHTNVF